MSKMLVTQGLNELKMLDSRIREKIMDADFIVASKTVEKNAKPGISKEDYKKNAKASYGSINDLIARREKIKAAIIASNAATEVKVAGEKMTVAKAIDKKSSIEYLTYLLSVMETQYNNAINKVEANEQIISNAIDKLVEAAYTKEGKSNINSNDYDAIAKPYRAANEVSLVDALNIQDKIVSLRDYIEKFNSEVDSVLQISNCVTYIEIE